MGQKLIFNAYNVHQGGGRRLLLPLLKSIGNKISQANLDKRLKLNFDLDQSIKVLKVRPSIVDRLICELKMYFKLGGDATIFCFGNLPPLFNKRSKVIVFLQNKHLVDKSEVGLLPFRVRVQVMLERWWFKWRAKHVDKFIVQTPTMQSKLQASFPDNKAPIVIVSLYDEVLSDENPINFQMEKKEEKFLYVASGYPGKNHLNLIKAWCLLAKENIFPRLVLTLSENNDRQLLAFISQLKQEYNISVENTGEVNFQAIRELYKSAKYLIFPSRFESFGLPLLEAQEYEMTILASELDYVRDILDPDYTFNPNSPRSIARAVKRSLKLPDQKINFTNSAQFMEHLI